MKATTVTVTVLFVFIVMTSLALVFVKHKSRTLFTELQGLSKAEIFLNEEWGRLLLEQSTVLSHGKVERVARNKLGMRLPEHSQVVVIQ